MYRKINCPKCDKQMVKFSNSFICRKCLVKVIGKWIYKKDKFVWETYTIFTNKKRIEIPQEDGKRKISTMEKAKDTQNRTDTNSI